MTVARDELMSKDFNPKFDALRNAIYHSSRRRFFELLNRSLSFLVVISGTAAVANLHSLEPRWLAAMAAIIGALQLVFDFGGRAHIHEVLQRRYFELVADIDGTANPTEEDFRKWQAVLGRIYADEPPPMRALDALSYNAACKSMGYDFEHYRRVNFWQWLWSHIYPFPRTNFAPLPAQTTT